MIRKVLNYVIIKMVINMTYTYQHKYDFSKSVYFGEMNEVFSKIYDNSIKYYLAHPDGYNKKNAFQKIAEYVQDLEIYLDGLVKQKYVSVSNVEHVKDTIKGIKTVGLLNSSWKNRIYGITLTDRIEVNPYLGPNGNLTRSDRTLLYIGHEVGHRFHSEWTNYESVQGLINDPDVKEIHKGLQTERQGYIYYGYDLLSEALTQDMAENIVYARKGMPRPRLSTYQKSIFGREPYQANFDFYGELQTPAVKFGRILRGVGKSSQSPDSEILHDLAKRAISKDFAREVEQEFKADGCKLDLFQLLHYMGIVKDASYGMFGMSHYKDSLRLSQDALHQINRISVKDEDYRERLGKH